jgi:hypothetical protein
MFQRLPDDCFFRQATASQTKVRGHTASAEHLLSAQDESMRRCMSNEISWCGSKPVPNFEASDGAISNTGSNW